MGRRHQYVDDARRDQRIALGPWQFRVQLRDHQPGACHRFVQVLDADPGVLVARFIRAGDLQEHDVDRHPAARDQPAQL